MNKEVTIVTGLWDLGRENTDAWCQRPFNENYVKALEKLLTIDANFFVYVPKELSLELKDKFWDKENIYFQPFEVEEFKTRYLGGAMYNQIQNIRKKDEWLKQEDWISGSPQAVLQDYNPMVMSKMFLLHDAKIYNVFKSNYFYWIDAGITNTVSYELLNSGVMDKLGREDFIFLTYPYEVQTQIHGFERTAMASYAHTDFVKYVCRGGFFGGYKDTLTDMNSIYYHLLNETLMAGLMGTEESIFTIMSYLYPDYISLFDLGGGGIQPYFEHLEKSTTEKIVSLYVITFNAPDQFEHLISSMVMYDNNFLDATKKYVLDNSDDEEMQARNKNIAETHGFEYLSTGQNLGITGGRQWIAEHFDNSGADFMIYFEDDMLFYSGNDEPSRSGLPRYVQNLYYSLLSIMRREKYDFLKLSFDEVFASNSTQTSWYNVSADKKKEYWGSRALLPFTKFNNIKIYNQIPYADGEVFYCNWPHIISRDGNKKVFLDREWLAPAEHRIMAYAYSLSRDQKLNSAVLLATPIEHTRLFDYDRENKRKEF